MQEAEQYFPRGGKIKRKAGDLREGKTDENKLFNDVPSKKAKKQGKVKEKKTKAPADIQKKNNVDEVTHVGPLRQEDLEPDMVLLGRVVKVDQLQLLVSLPCHLVGAVPVTNISATYSGRLLGQDQPAPTLSELFSPGQYVNCAVVKADVSGRKVRNTLSARPSDVNASLPAAALRHGQILQCSVKSEEDNVYDIDCGIPRTRAVLPKSGLGSDPPALVAGQIVWCMVDTASSVDGVHILKLTADPARLNNATPSADADVTSQTLLPGMRVPITVHKVLRGGLEVRLPGGSPAFVYKTQLDEPADCPDDYNAGAATHARVLCTLPVVRRTFVSLRPAAGRLPAAALDAMLLAEPAVRHAATVLDADERGVRLLLEGGRVAFAPVWHTGRVGAGRFKRGEAARCTLLAYDAMDELYIASMKSAKQTPAPAASLSVGQRAKCRVRELLEHGCAVELDGGVSGFIPNHHLTNVPVKQMQTMFPVGKRLKCKVITTDLERRRVTLTHNARLVDTELDLVSAPAQLKVGEVHHWIVAKVTEKGLIMTGYSDLSGFVPEAFTGSDLNDYFPGQILQCVVHKRRTEAGGGCRATLRPLREGADPAWCGRLTTARVTGRTAGRLLVTIGDGQQAELPAGHLTDVPEHAAAAIARYKTGDELEVVGLVSLGKKVIVSAKPLLLEGVKNGIYPSGADKLSAAQPGQPLACSVVRFDQRGVLVAFPCQHMAGTYRIKLQALCDGWEKDMASMTSLKDRTLLAEVLPNRDSSSKFVRFSARLDARKDKDGVAYLRRCVRDLAALVPASPRPGDQVTGRPVSQSPAGITLHLPDGRRGVVPTGDVTPADDVTDGGDITATVVQVTPTGHLILAVGHDVQPSAGQSSLVRSQSHQAKVVASDSDCYMWTALLLPPAPPCLVHLPVRRGLNDLTRGTPAPPLGHVLQVVVKGAKDGILIGTTNANAEPGRRRSKAAKKLTKKPAKKLGRKEKHWKKKSRTSLSARPTPKRPQNNTSIRYSRFSLQDDC